MKKTINVTAIIFAEAAIILLPLRTYQYFTVIEPSTGFYQEFDWTAILFGAVSAAAILAFVSIGLSNRKEMVISTKAAKLPSCGIFSFMTAAFLFMNAYVCFTGDHISKVTAETQIRMDGLYAIQGILAILSAVYFILMGIIFVGAKKSSKYRVLSLCPVVWSMIRLVIGFAKPISYAKVSELFLNMMMVIFFILFFMNFAQVNGRVASEGLEWKVFSYGFCAALFALVTFIPNFVLSVTGKAYMLYADANLEYCDFGIAMLALATVLTRISSVKGKTEIVKAEE